MVVSGFSNQTPFYYDLLLFLFLGYCIVFLLQQGGCTTTCWVACYPVNWVHCNSCNICKLIFKPYTFVIYFCFWAISLFFCVSGICTTTCWVAWYPVNWVHCNSWHVCKLISNQTHFIVILFFCFGLFSLFFCCNRSLYNNSLTGTVSTVATDWLVCLFPFILICSLYSICLFLVDCTRMMDLIAIVLLDVRLRVIATTPTNVRQYQRRLLRHCPLLP